jgi:hypothetical protein
MILLGLHVQYPHQSARREWRNQDKKHQAVDKFSPVHRPVPATAAHAHLHHLRWAAGRALSWMPLELGCSREALHVDVMVRTRKIAHTSSRAAQWDAFDTWLELQAKVQWLHHLLERKRDRWAR